LPQKPTLLWPLRLRLLLMLLRLLLLLLLAPARLQRAPRPPFLQVTV
jgi:hypothetical protein